VTYPETNDRLINRSADQRSGVGHSPAFSISSRSHERQSLYTLRKLMTRIFRVFSPVSAHCRKASAILRTREERMVKWWSWVKTESRTRFYIAKGGWRETDWDHFLRSSRLQNKFPEVDLEHIMITLYQIRMLLKSEQKPIDLFERVCHTRMTWCIAEYIPKCLFGSRNWASISEEREM